MDWWPILTTQYGDRIEWSPGKGKNLRVKKTGGEWLYAEATSAQYALSLGEGLLDVGSGRDERPEGPHAACPVINTQHAVGSENTFRL